MLRTTIWHPIEPRAPKPRYRLSTKWISLTHVPAISLREIYRAPETWAQRAYRNLIYFHEVDKGGHFAAWEQPDLFSAELRAAFRSLG